MTQEYIGIDLHNAFFQVCAVSPSGHRLWEARWARTPDGVAQLLPRLGPTSRLAVEASGPTWAFVDHVGTTGAAVCVVDPRKTKLKGGFAAKTDRLDARRLADALRRQSVVSIYIPPPAGRELREVCRSRDQLVRLRTRLAQLLRALLLRSGVADAIAVAVGRHWTGTGVDVARRDRRHHPLRGRPPAGELCGRRQPGRSECRPRRSRPDYP
jgi:transposase